MFYILVKVLAGELDLFVMLLHSLTLILFHKLKLEKQSLQHVRSCPHFHAETWPLQRFRMTYCHFLTLLNGIFFISVKKQNFIKIIHERK